MLDGLLGRNGFSSKCKPLIKLTRRRVDVIRRKRVATQKFLKKDIADLLAAGLEHNASGRAEALMSELILSSCYDFIDHVCEIILKNLSAMQKQSDCPEECKEAVGSLMFAAARFSDLPELREVRDVFQERYGSSMECHVNQKLVQHISSKPPSTEQKLQLLQDVVSEFSMTRDSSDFEPRVTSIPYAREVSLFRTVCIPTYTGKGLKVHKNESSHDQPKAQAPLYDAWSKHRSPQAEKPDQKKDVAARLAKKMAEASPQIKSREASSYNGELHESTRARDPFHTLDQMKHTVSKGHELRFSEQRSLPGSKTTYKIGKYDPSHRRVYTVDNIPENVEPLLYGEKLGDKIEDHAQNVAQKGQESSSGSPRRVVVVPPKVEKLGNCPSYDKYDCSNNIVIPARKLPGEDTDYGFKSNKKSSIPPPYVKPQRSKDKSKLPDMSGNGVDGGFLSDDRCRQTHQSQTAQNKDEYLTEEYYKADDDSPGDPTLRRRPRRRHTKSSSGSDNGGEVRVIGRTSTSRRRREASIKGLQIVFDDEHGEQKDEEEQMLDKLLLKHCKGDSSVAAAASELESPRSKGKNKLGPVWKHTARSFSLPREKMYSASSEKVFGRAVSFNQEPSTPAKHVHPKLPDYDDLAARFAALRRGDE